MWSRCGSRSVVLATPHAPGLASPESIADGLDVRLSLLYNSSLFSDIANGCSGNLLVTSSTTSCMIALTWGGIQFPWTSAHVLVPLILGLVGLALFLMYEALFATEPLVSNLACGIPSFSLVSLRRFLSHSFQTVQVLVGTYSAKRSRCISDAYCRRYVQNFINPVVMISVVCKSRLAMFA